MSSSPVASSRDGAGVSRGIMSALLRLRFRVLFNTLRRNTWQMVGAIIGAVYGLGVLGFVVIGLIALAFAPEEPRATVLVLAGSALVLGWTLIPLVTAGVDQTLDPAKLMVFPIPLRTLLLGLTVAGVLGIPGIITSVAALSSALSYLSSPLALLAAIPSAAVGVLVCVVASRAVTAASTGLSSRRRFRELVGVLIFVPLILLGPIIAGAARGIANIADALPGIAEALGWTPLGAAWAVPAAVAAGAPWEALLKFAIAVATLLILLWLWSRGLAGALVAPAASANKTVARGKIGLLGVLPATPAGAITARSLIYWLRDPRYARQLIVVPLIPILLLFYSNTMGTLFVLVLAGPIIGFLLSVTFYADISYDGTAFAAHIIDGVRGIDDRIGRVAALSLIGVPLTLVVTVVSVAFAGSWDLLPSALGMAIGLFGAGVGVSAVSSARIVMPVPGPGDNPFKAAPGATFTTGLSAFVIWGLALLLALPVIVVAIIGFVTTEPLWNWLALAVGVLIAVLWTWLGVRMGRRELDQRAPDLLSRMKRASA